MSDSHAKLPKLFWVQLALAAVIGIIYLFTPSEHSEDAKAEEGKVAAVTKNIEPVGAVATKEAKTSGSTKARSGEEVYRASCMACHASGVANAPKFGDKAAWEPRAATGLDALMNSALNGKGAMPARGGNPAISDEEIKAVILYMTGKAGFDLSATKKSEPAPAAMAKTEKPVEESTPNAVSTTIPSAPSAPAAPAAPVAMDKAPAKPVEPETKMEVASVEPTAPVINNNAKGEKIYNSACFACHAAGVAGSPKFADKTAWAPRIATGKDALYTSAISGKGVMPPKGGNMGLSDDDVKAAVDYMIAQSQ